MPSSAPSDQGDRRKRPRLPRRLPVRFGSEAKMLGGSVIDISEGGLKVESPDSFPVNSILQVFVHFPRHAVRLRARVAWAGGKGGGSPTMGLTFTQSGPALLKAYKEWVTEVKLALQKEDEAASQAPPAGGAGSAPPVQGVAASAQSAPVGPGATSPGRDVRPDASVAPPSGSQRRRIETRRGNSYDVLIERRRGAWGLTIVQLPRQLGVDEPDLDEDFPGYGDAERALRGFLKDH